MKTATEKNKAWGNDARHCPGHTMHPDRPDDYLARQAWMAKMEKTHTQTQCPVCKLWAVWVPKERRKTP